MLFFCYVFCVNNINVLFLHCQKSRFDAAVKHRRLGREVRLYLSLFFVVCIETF